MLGVLPWLDGLWLDAEDSLGLAAPRRPAPPPVGATCCGSRSSGCRGMSNFTDVDALGRRARRRGALVTASRRSWPTPTWSCCPAPGPRSPTWPGCASAGLADAVGPRRRPGGRCSGICGGYQMLGPHDHGRGRVAGAARSPGSACCRCDVTFGGGEDAGPAGGAGVRGAGATATRSTTAWSTADRRAEPFLDGCRSAPSGARPGTARWRATASGGRSCADVAALAGAGLHAGAGHRVRRRPGGLPGRARRPGRAAPRHAGAPGTDRQRPAARAALRAARRAPSPERKVP